MAQNIEDLHWDVHKEHMQSHEARVKLPAPCSCNTLCLITQFVLQPMCGIDNIGICQAKLRMKHGSMLIAKGLLLMNC